MAGVYLAEFLPPDRIALAILGPAWFVLADLVHASTFAVLRMEARASWMDREWIARLSASEILSMLTISGLAAICLVLPHWINGLLPRAGLASVPALLTGPLAAMLGRWTKTPAGGDASAGISTSVVRQLPTILAVVASLVFLLTLLMGGSALGWRAAALLAPGCYGELVWDQPSPCAPAGWLLFVLAVLLFAASWSLGQWVININRFSLHEVYRNRLVRAFLGSARDANVRRTTVDGFTWFNEKDSMRLSEALPHYPVHDARQGLRLSPGDQHGTQFGLGDQDRVERTQGGLIHHDPAALRIGGSGRGGQPDRRIRPDPGLWRVATDVPSGRRLSRDADGHRDDDFRCRGQPERGIPLVADHGVHHGLVQCASGRMDAQPSAGHRHSDEKRQTAQWLHGLARGNVREDQRYESGGLFVGWRAFRKSGTVRNVPPPLPTDRRDRCGRRQGLCLQRPRRRTAEIAHRSGRGGHISTRRWPHHGCGPGVSASCVPKSIIHAGAGVPPMTGVLLYVKAHMPTTSPADVLAYQSAHTDFPNEPTSNQFFTESQFESYRRLGDYLAS